MIVQPDLGIGQVVVVDQDQIRPRLVVQLGHLGEVAGHVGLHPQAPGQPCRGPVVQADGDPVRSQRGREIPGVRDLLPDGERPEPALRVGLVERPQGGHSGRFQPRLGPARQVPAGGLFKGREQVGEGGVAPGVPGEVAADRGQEVVLAHVGHELLEHGGALGVGDPVEVHLDRGDVVDVGGDRVGRRQLVLPVGPGLPGMGERGPGVRPPGNRGLGHDRRPAGERLVQPQVVPPAHGDQVAEPHVRHLVQDRLGPALPLGVGDPGAEQVALQERDAAGVLHRARLVLGHEQLVVLAERVAHPERAVEVVEALPGDLEDLVRVQVGGQRLAAVDAERDPVVAVPHLMVGAGHQRGDIGRYRRRRREVPAPGAGPGRLTGPG